MSFRGVLGFLFLGELDLETAEERQPHNSVMSQSLCLQSQGLIPPSFFLLCPFTSLSS